MLVDDYFNRYFDRFMSDRFMVFFFFGFNFNYNGQRCAESG